MAKAQILFELLIALAITFAFALLLLSISLSYQSHFANSSKTLSASITNTSQAINDSLPEGPNFKIIV